MLLELPEHVLEGVLAQLDPISLDCACQSCVSLLVTANRLGAPYARSCHWLETAASQCLSSLVHCSVGNLLQALKLDYSLSTRFPLTLTVRAVRQSLNSFYNQAAADVTELADRTAKHLQACIRAEQRSSNRRPSDPISFFSACRADRGYVRLALHAPAAVRVSLLRLEALCPGGAAWEDVPGRCQPDQAALMLAVLLEQGLGLERTYGPARVVRQAPGPSRWRQVESCQRSFKQLLCGLQALLHAGTCSPGVSGSTAVADSEPAWATTAALASAAAAAWGSSQRVLQAATAADMQLLVTLEQARQKQQEQQQPGGSSQETAASAAALLEVGAALSHYLNETGGSALGCQLTPSTTALTRMAALLRNEGGGGQSSAAGGLPARAGATAGEYWLRGVGEQHPREALLVLTQLAALRCMVHLGALDLLL